MAATIQRVMNDDVIDRIADALVALQDKESTMLPSLQQQLKECEKSIQNMLNAIEAGIITPSMKERLQSLEARREEIKIAIMQEQLQRPKLTKEQIVFWISRYKHGNPNDLDYQRQIIDTFVNRIYVYDDKLVLTYNYKDGTESITLEDIQKAFGSDLSSIAPPKRRDPSLIPVGNEFGSLFLPGHCDVTREQRRGMNIHGVLSLSPVNSCPPASLLPRCAAYSAATRCWEWSDRKRR